MNHPVPFYTLTHPDYETDHAAERMNPLRQIERAWIPGIRCRYCNQTWAGSRKLYLPLPNGDIRQRLIPSPLENETWQDLVRAMRQALNLPDDFVFRPGDELGVPRYELLSTTVPDLLHPFPGTIVVTEKVEQALREAALTGYRPLSVAVRWGARFKQNRHPPPSLWGLHIHGQAGRIGSRFMTDCEHCGRTRLQVVGTSLDRSRWDNTDFFHIDINPNIVGVTERVCDLLASHRFSNYRCLPLNSS